MVDSGKVKLLKILLPLQNLSNWNNSISSSLDSSHKIMTTQNSDNKHLSELLVSLHHAANVVSPDKFRVYALKLIHSFIPFDSAVWGKHSRIGGELVTNEMYLHGSQTDKFQSMEYIQKVDACFIKSKFARPWITANLNCSQSTAALSSELDQYFKIIGVRHCLCTIGYDPFSHTPHHIMLGRNNSMQPYTEHERLLKQILMPHLEAACDQNYRLLPQDLNNNSHQEERRQANALTNNQGVLFTTEPRFIELLTSEFPDWNGPLLPEPLLQSFIGQNNDRHVGISITLTARRRSSMWLLWARHKQPIDDLSERTIKLATYFADGLNHKEIGQKMNISPSTVRNHISIVYNKLQVSNKSQLSQLLSGVRQPRMRG